MADGPVSRNREAGRLDAPERRAADNRPGFDASLNRPEGFLAGRPRSSLSLLPTLRPGIAFVVASQNRAQRLLRCPESKPRSSPGC